MTTCPVCRTEFEPKKRHGKQPPQRFCSRLCGSRSTAKARGEAQRTLSPKECESCGKTFQPVTASIRFCTRQCYYDSCGHRYAAGHGYWRIKVPKGTPGADGNGRMLEHRYVMQESLGRPLTQKEVVHHLNGDRGDNRLENLALAKVYHGKGQRFRCRACGSHDVEAIDL